MKMGKLFKDTVGITNDNIILAFPLILFMWVLSLYVSFSRQTVNSLPLLILSSITVLVMTGAFFAGWFYMVKKAVKLSKQVFVLDTDRAKATFNLLKTIPAGIGKYFLSYSGMIILFVIIICIVGAGVFQLGVNLIGKLDLNPEQLKSVLSSAADMKAFLDSLSFEQLIRLNNWNLLFLATTTVMSFLFMLWAPEIAFNTKNPFTALINSVKKIFHRFGRCLKLFVFLTVLNFVLSFINTFSLFNPILYFIMTVVYFYFFVYLVMLIFLYYEREFTEE